ncbi:MAG TPA: Rrf2 family transcriptional regulator [Saprospiraceae bacterium]|nr:Rrf2 family transcriptional regulator [Saprospiraceae bacterium]
MLSKTCEYAIRACIFIAKKSREHQKVCLKDIADYIGSPVAFTAKILQQLSRNHLLESAKGPNGGFIFNEEKLQNLTLSDIVHTIDGKEIYNRCVLGLENCSEQRPCPLHTEFKTIRAEIRLLLMNTKVTDLSEDLTQGKGFLRS